MVDENRLSYIGPEKCREQFFFAPLPNHLPLAPWRATGGRATVFFCTTAEQALVIVSYLNSGSVEEWTCSNYAKVLDA